MFISLWQAPISWGKPLTLFALTQKSKQKKLRSVVIEMVGYIVDYDSSVLADRYFCM